jgi:hypothetical protein
VTVRLVPATCVTFMSSLPTEILNGVTVGKPVVETTEIVVCVVDVTPALSVVLAEFAPFHVCRTDASLLLSVAQLPPVPQNLLFESRRLVKSTGLALIA